MTTPSFDYLFERDEEELRRQGLRAANVVADDAGLEPDTAAQVWRQGQEQGVPPSVALRSPEDIRREAEARRLERLAQDAPGVAGWIAEKPERLTVARDELEGLAAIEKFIDAWTPDRRGGGTALGLVQRLQQGSTDAFLRAPAAGAVGYVGQAIAGVGHLYGALDRSMQRGLRAVFGPDLWGDDVELPWFLSPADILTRPGDQLSAGAQALGVPEERQSLGTDITGGVGQLGGMTAQAIVAPQTLVPGLFGLGASQQANEAIQAGQYGTAEADAAVWAGAGTTAALERFGLEKLLNRIPPKIKNDALRWLADKGVAFGWEGGQEAVEAVAQDVITAGTFDPSQEIGEGIGREATVAGTAGAIVRTLLGVRSPLKPVLEASEDAQQLERLHALGAELKTIDRAPEEVEAFVRQVVDRSPGAPTHVYLDATQLVTMFQSANLDPAQEIERLTGDVDGLRLAVAAGGDVVVPIERYVARGLKSPQAEQLRDMARLAPDRASNAELRNLDVDELFAGMDTAAAADRADPAVGEDPVAVVAGQVRAQLEMAGVEPSAAAAQADLIAQRYATRAARRGKGETALQVYEATNLTIRSNTPGDQLRRTRPGPTIESATDSVLDALRASKGDSVYDDAEVNGPTLAEVLAAKGGLRDDALTGELRSLGESDRASRKGKPRLVRDDGIELDNALEVAKESGYLPEDADLNDLLEALSDEVVAGKPRYSEANRNLARTNFRAAADSLAELLAENNLDLSTMTNAQVREAIARIYEQQDFKGLTDTPAFKAWFGDSKVVDENGAPLVVYHGTRANIEGFHSGSWFSPSTKVAASFINGRRGNVRKGGKAIYPVFLSIKTPLKIPRVTDMASAVDMAAMLGLSMEEYRARAMVLNADKMAAFQKSMRSASLRADFEFDFNAIGEPTMYLSALRDEKVEQRHWPVWQYLDSTAFRAIAEQQGFDGVVTTENGEQTWQAFRAEQVKSVNNRGTFDPNDASILNQSDLARALAMSEDDYIAAVNPTGKRIDADDRMIVHVGDFDLPSNVVPVESFVAKDGTPTSISRDAQGNLYAHRGTDVYGMMGPLDDETVLDVAQEAQGQGIGVALAKAYIREQPFALSGGFTAGGEATRRAAFRALKGEHVARVLRQTPIIEQTDTDEFKAWSQGAPVVDDLSDYEGGPAVLRLVHGTTSEFDAFDRTRANPESDFGAGFYFSNTPEDVGANYAGLGPDLTNKIERRAEQLFDEMDDEERIRFVEAETGKKWSELSYGEKREPLRALARRELASTNEGLTMPVFVRVLNPAVVGGPNETRLTFSEEYDEETDSFDEPTGTLIALMDALREIEADGEVFDFKAEKTISDIFGEHWDNDSIGLSDLVGQMKGSEGLMYATDENGNSVAHEVIRQALERAGFDSIIDYTVDEKFGSQKRIGKQMEGMHPDTVHVIAFQPTQIKSAIGNNGEFNPNDPRILFQSANAPFYSAALRAVEEGKGAPKRGDAAAWKGWLDGAVRRGDMKQAERDWLGIDAWLEGQGQVTREQLVEFVRANEVKVEPVVLGAQEAETLADVGAISSDLQNWLEGTLDDPDDSQTGERWREIATMLDDDAASYAEDGYAEGEAKAKRLAAEARAIADKLDRGEVEHPKPTKFGSYQLPGGENYRELLLTLPEGDTSQKPEIVPHPTRVGQFALRFPTGEYVVSMDGGASTGRTTDAAKASYWSDPELAAYGTAAHDRRANVFRSGHFDQPNIVAHVRFNERADADGKRVLFIEEIQSDWHQAGRKRGYGKATPGKITPEEGGTWRIEWDDGTFSGGYGSEETARNTMELRRSSADKSGVPDAPFKATDEWAMLAFKRMARWAVDNGFERIAWTTGEQQNQRYKLSQHIREIRVVPASTPDGQRLVRMDAKEGGTLEGFKLLVDKDGNTTAVNPASQQFGGKKLDDVIGKDMAERVMAASKDTRFTGTELDVGGSGMKGFYDKILPSAVNKWAKKFGAKVGDTTIPSDDGVKRNKAKGLSADHKAEVRALAKTADEFSFEEFNEQLREIAGIEVSEEGYEDLVGDARGAGVPTGAVTAFVKWANDEVKRRAIESFPAHSIDITPAMRDAVQAGQPLFQKQGQDDARGRILLGNDGSRVIELLENADLSTFHHETGHLFLEELIEDAFTEGTPVQLRADLDAVLAWFGVEARTVDGADAVRAAIEVKHHEQFARGYEAFLMEGAAPAPEVSDLFAKFRTWMIAVYKAIKALNVTLTPEVRSVYDRLIATDEQIEAAKQTAGWQPLAIPADVQAILPEGQWRTYEGMVRAATEEARTQVQRRLLAAQQREAQAWWKEKRAELEEVVTREAHGRLDFIALSVLRRNKMPDGSDPPEHLAGLVIDRQALVDLYGERFVVDTLGPLKVYRKGRNRTRKEMQTLGVAGASRYVRGGMTPSAVAAVLGYPDGGALVDALVNAPNMREWIKAETDARLREQYPDPLLDGTLPATALAAVHNDRQLQALEAELGMLAALAADPTAIPADAPRAAAGTTPENPLPKERMADAPVGAWVDGGDIPGVGPTRFQIREVPLDQLDPRELSPGGEIDGAKKRDAEAYRARLEAGEQAPNARGYELEDGSGRISLVDGHRRLVAARAAGRPTLRVAVSPLTQPVAAPKARAPLSDAQRARMTAATRQRAAEARAIGAAARRRIAGMKPREVRPNDYLVAERKAADRAAKAAAQGNYAAALKAKREQTLNAHLYRAARDAVAEVESAREYLRRFTRKDKRAALGKAGGSYLEQIDGLLELVELRAVSGRTVERRAGLAEWVKARAAAGEAIDVPDAVLALTKVTNLRDMPVEQVRGLVDTIKQIDHLARLKGKLMLGALQRDRAEVDEELAASIRAARQDVPVTTGDRTLAANVRAAVNQAEAAYLRPSTLTRSLDGYENGGAVWTHTVGVIQNAVNNVLNPALEQAQDALAKLWLKHYTPAELRALGTARSRASIGVPDAWSKARILSLALNWGNEGNRAAILSQARGRLAPEQIGALLGTLDQRDVAFVQEVWDFIDTFWPAIAEAQQRRTGLVPPKVEASPFAIRLADGTMAELRGGYYPLKYEAGTDPKATQDENTEFWDAIRTGRFAKAQTKNGHTKERVGSGGRTVNLDLSVMTSHVRDVLRDVHLGDAVNYVHHVLKGDEFRNALTDVGKLEFAQALELWLRDVATGEMAPRTFIERMGRKLRTNFTASLLGFSVSTALVQPTGFLQTGAAMGWGNLAVGMKRLLSMPWVGANSVTSYVDGASPMMAARAQGSVESVRKVSKSLAGQRDGFILRHTWILMAKTQRIVDLTTWLAAEAQGLAEFDGDVKRARAYADDTVQRAQASGEFIDKSALERGTFGDNVRQSEIVRTSTALMSYMIAKGNIIFERTGQTNFRNPRQVAKYAVDLTSLLVIENLVIALMRGGLPDDEDDDGIADDAALWFFKEGALGLLSTIPIVAQSATTLRGYDAQGVVERITKAGMKFGKAALEFALDDEELTASDLKAGVSLVGMLTGLPAAQINRTLDAYLANLDGEDVAAHEYILGQRKE
jgi:hypothetical protein